MDRDKYSNNDYLSFKDNDFERPITPKCLLHNLTVTSYSLDNSKLSILPVLAKAGHRKINQNWVPTCQNNVKYGNLIWECKSQSCE